MRLPRDRNRSLVEYRVEHDHTDTVEFLIGEWDTDQGSRVSEDRPRPVVGAEDDIAGRGHLRVEVQQRCIEIGDPCEPRAQPAPPAISPQAIAGEADAI